MPNVAASFEVDCDYTPFLSVDGIDVSVRGCEWRAETDCRLPANFAIQRVTLYT
jgi:hypothetical protein